MTTPSRLLMAAKTALAAVAAWYLAPLLPFTDEQYSYYAPLGVLVSMYPTVAASARSGLQAIIGLGIGIGLGLLGVVALSAGVPVALTLAIVLAVGVLFSGLRALGIGRGWVAIAALFVLLVSGGDTEDFSLSYLVTMGFGIVVGVAVNLLVVPPLYLDQASRRLTDLRNSLSSLMSDIADHVERGTVDAETFEASVGELDRTTADVRAEVYEADESRKANPRGLRRRATSDENLARLRALERAAFYIRDLADVLGMLRRTDDVALGPDVAPALAEAIRACCALVAASVRSADSPTRLKEADASLERYLVALTRATGDGKATIADELAPVALLRRTIDASLPFVRDDAG